MHTRLSNLRSAAIKNPYLPGKYGGYFGEVSYTKHGNLKAYNAWSKILIRINTEFNETYSSRNLSYKNTLIDERWYNFQNFADWYEKYISLLNPKYYNNYQIDKDILTWRTDIKIYSPETCCIVPYQINLSISNLYRERLIENLPMGVHKDGNRYCINISFYGSMSNKLGTYKTPEEAFEVYKSEKERYIKELAYFYYNENAILENAYEALLKINIKPYK